MGNVFGALSDPTRREILNLLKKGDMPAGAICDHFTMKAPTISHHLNILRDAGLVTSTKDGQKIIYSLNTTVLQDVLNWIFALKGDEDHA